jgi:ParB family chromosome partitioning protein
MLMAGDIDMGHARALLAVDAATQIQLANQVVAKRMSVRDTEKLVAKTTAELVAPSKQKDKAEKSRDITQLEEELSDLLATQVTLKMGSKGRGQMVIDFADLDSLDGVILKIRGQ